MAISGDGGRIQRQNIAPADFQQARETRQARLDAKVQDASLAPTGRMSSEQIKEHQGFLNRSIGDLDKLQGGGVLGCIKPDFGKMFPVPSDWKIQDATKPSIFDNGKARDVKSEYAAANAEANRERTQAVRTSGKLGPGDHQLSNGDKVNVAVDKKTGEHTVTTTRADGSTKTVTYSDKDHDSVKVDRKDQFGREESLEKDGTRITREEQQGGIFGGIMGGGLGGGKTKTTYDVNDQGNAERTQSGPAWDDWERTTVNDNGSTDTKKLIYRDENGQPAYEETHQRSMLEPMPWPHPIDPWRPFPHPRFQWDLDDFRPKHHPMLFGEAQAN